MRTIIIVSAITIGATGALARSPFCKELTEAQCKAEALCAFKPAKVIAYQIGGKDHMRVLKASCRSHSTNAAQ